MMSLLHQQILQVVCRIPVGRVATYGQVARLARYPGHARQVGYVLFRCPEGASEVPWQRVVNARGEISYAPQRFGSDDLQKVLLLEEGIEFDGQGRIDLKTYGWDPDPGEFRELSELIEERSQSCSDKANT